MNNDYIKIKNCLDESILIQINELSYMQNLRNGIEFYEESKTNKFFDSIMEYILLNDIDLKFKKFIVFWIDYVIQNYGDCYTIINSEELYGEAGIFGESLCGIKYTFKDLNEVTNDTFYVTIERGADGYVIVNDSYK